ncbi:MAG: NAD-dependent epimerase/dehydratase family protein [Candidatus Aminicenantales bacterium]
MNILVTGGTGFIGSHLLESLPAGGNDEIHALVRDPRRLGELARKSGLRVLEGDLSAVPPLPSSIDVVYHLAGLTKASKSNSYYTVNQKGTASLFAKLLDQPRPPRVVLLSSLAACGPCTPEGPIREDDPPRPVSPYGDSKLQAEQEAWKLRDRLPVSILRVGAVFGPRDEDFLSYFRILKKGILPLVGQRPRYLSLCYVKDIVRAMMMAAGSPAAFGEVFNIAEAKPRSWEEFGKAAARAMGKKVVPVRVPLWAAAAGAALSGAVSRLTRNPTPLNLSKYRDMKAYGWTADVEKARTILGFESRFSLEDALRETIDWYVRNGKL